MIVRFLGLPIRGLILRLSIRPGLAASRLLIFCLLAVFYDATAASPVVDPYLERFRVGYYREPPDIQLRDGWPEDLFTPLFLDESWLSAAQEFFAQPHLRQSSSHLTWRILAPALGSVQAQSLWVAGQHRRLEMLLAAGQGAVLEVPVDSDSRFLLKEICYVSVFNNHQKEDYESAIEQIEEMLAAAARLDLTTEEVFVWSLRKRALQGRRGRQRPQENEHARSVPAPSATADSPVTVWSEMFDLSLYDAQSGWAIWIARQRALGRPAIPPGEGSPELAKFLLGLRQHWLDESEITRAGFSSDATAGIGALALPAGAALDSLFKRHPQPPQKKVYLEPWLRGQRRQARYAPEKAEQLARMAGIPAELQVDLWRRASEARLLRGDWDAGLEDLASALMLAGGLTRGREVARLWDWTDQALVLAWAHDRRTAAEQIEILAGTHLPVAEAERFRDRARYWRGRFTAEAPACSPGGENRLEAARQLVKQGEGADIQRSETPDLNRSGARCWDAQWRVWAGWGLALADAAFPQAACPDPRDEEYRLGLRDVAEAATPAARLALACASCGRYLRGRPQLAAVLGWTIEWDLTCLVGEQLIRGRTPMVALAGDEQSTMMQTRFMRHALLGICLATGDGRGQLALVTSLPRERLESWERLLMLHPVPPPGALLDAVGKSGVEAALVLAVIRNESLFDPTARSEAGALGWMQIMPFHYAGQGYSAGRPIWRDPYTSLAAGARLLLESADRYRADPYRSLAAYNAGSGAVERWDRQLGNPSDGNRHARDVFLAWIGYPETRRYTEKVLIAREIYDWILHEPWDAEPKAAPPAEACSGSSP